jgi:DNA polymerase III delta prime subunit
MDMIQQISDIPDIGLQNLLTHSMRYALQHSNIASTAAAQADKSTDPNQVMQAVAIHRDTAMLMNEMVKVILAAQPAPEKPKPTKRGKQPAAD